MHNIIQIPQRLALFVYTTLFKVATWRQIVQDIVGFGAFVNLNYGCRLK